MRAGLLFIAFFNLFSAYSQFKVFVNADTTDTFSRSSSGIRFVVPVGHLSAVMSFSVDPDERRLVTASVDNTAKIWDLNTGHQLHTLSGHRAPVVSVRFSKDGSKIITASVDNSAAVWSSKTGQFLAELKGDVSERNVSIAEFSPDGKNIMTASGKRCKIWTSSTAELLYEVADFNEEITWASYSNDGQSIAVLSADNIVRILKAKTGEPVFTIKGDTILGSRNLATFYPHKNILFTVLNGILSSWDLTSRKLLHTFNKDSIDIYSINFDREGDLFSTASSDSTVRIWDLKNGKVLKTLPQQNSSSLVAFFSPDGKQLVTNLDDGKLIFWDTRSGTIVKQIQAHLYEIIFAEFTSKGDKIITVSTDFTAKSWDAKSGELLQHFRGLTDPIGVAEFSSDGKKIRATSGVVKVLDIEKGNLSIDFIGHTGAIYFSSFNRDGKYFITSSYDSTAKLWNSTDGTLVTNFVGHTDVVTRAELSPDGRHVLSSSRDRTVRLWDARNGRLLKVFAGHKKAVAAATFNPTGESIASASWEDTSVIIWDIKTAKIVSLLKGHKGAIEKLSYSRDGKYLLTATDDKFGYVWEASTGNLRYTLGEHTPKIYSASFSNDSKKIVTTSEYGVVRIWDANTGKLLHDLKGHSQNLVFSSAFSPDSKLLATASDNVIIWDMSTGRKVSEFYKTNTLINSVRFHPDSRQVITSSWENVVRVWNSQDGQLRYSFLIVDTAEVFVQLPSNYYFSTPNVAKKLHYVTEELNVITFEQLDAKYNRPDIVLASIGSRDSILIKSYQNAYQKRMKKLGIDTNYVSQKFTVPECEFTNRNVIQFEQEEGFLRLIVNAKDTTYPLTKFNVWINEVPLFGSKGVNLKWKKTQHFDTTIVITLSNGFNRIETSVTNLNGIESYRKPLYVNYASQEKVPEKTYFVGLGIDRYRDKSKNLLWSVKDIRDLAKLLKDNIGSSLQIDTLLNEKLSVNNVVQLKRKLLNTGINDKVILCYSGHGLLNNRYDYFLCMHETDFENPEQGGLPYEMLESLLDSIPARRKLILIDACHSGEVDAEEFNQLTNVKSNLKGVVSRGVVPVNKDSTRTGVRKSARFIQELFANVSRNSGATVIAAAAGTQFALERGDLQNGVFTYSIMEYCRKNASVLVSALRKYVNRRVSDLTQGLQVPTTRAETLEADWHLWQN